MSIRLQEISQLTEQAISFCNNHHNSYNFINDYNLANNNENQVNNCITYSIYYRSNDTDTLGEEAGFLQLLPDPESTSMYEILLGVYPNENFRQKGIALNAIQAVQNSHKDKQLTVIIKKENPYRDHIINKILLPSKFTYIHGKWYYNLQATN